MTAIAYVNGVLAVDSLVTEGDVKYCRMDKASVVTVKNGTYLLAWSGDVAGALKMSAIIEEFIRQTWRKEGLTEEEFCRRVVDEVEFPERCAAANLLVVLPSGAYATFGGKVGFDGKFSRYTPYSSGGCWEYLRGAMDAGAGPEDAVHLACKNITHVGGPVRVYHAGQGQIANVIPRSHC